MKVNLKKYEKEFQKLLKNDIRKKGSIRTGAMISSIDPIFEIKKNKILINVKGMYYYKYVDNGTKYIKARKFSEDVLNSNSFEKLVKDLTFEIVELEIDNIFYEWDKSDKNVKYIK